MARGRLCLFCCPLVIMFILCGSCAQARPNRFGVVANTLHFHPLSEAEKWGEKFHILHADPLKDPGKQLDVDQSLDDQVDNLLRRFRRDAAVGSQINTTAAPLNDSHSMLIVHWAGELSSVIIALAKTGHHSLGASPSKLYISRDYGKSFTDITANVTSGHPTASIDKYYNTDQMNSHYVFTDVSLRCMFTTRDYARTFSSHCGLPFRPKTLSLNPNNVNHILAFDEDSSGSPLYVSQNFGRTWRRMRDETKSFFWGVQPYDSANTVYVEEKRGSGGNAVLRTHDCQHFESVIEGVEDFQVQDEYLFATKRQHLLGPNYSAEGSLQFWVSYRRRQFVNAQFPAQHGHSDYYVADASEGQVMLCVVHNTSNVSLYISDVYGTRFSLSLERIVYFNPQGAHKDTWLSYYSNETFADVHKVAGLRGIYIASQLIASNSSFSVENQRSLVSYDKGGEWELLNSPQVLHGRPNTNCSKSRNCSLHLSQEFSRLYPGSQVQPILSRPSAPGILLASGTVGASLKSQQDLFVSRDAGYTWFQVMDGNYQFSMADHGGVMLAAQQFQPTNTVYYSIDEGESWTPYPFASEAIRIYGILTEPGEKTTVFSIFGSKPDHHRWILYQLNVTGLLGVRCTPDDYKDWSLPDQFPDAGCLLGQKLVYKRRIAHARCYNGHSFVQFKDLRNCSCTRDDYECDFGYKPVGRLLGINCERDSAVNSSLIHQVPPICPPGTLYPYTRGYRRVAGDTCRGGQDNVYEPLKFSCPVREKSFEFDAGARAEAYSQSVDVDGQLGSQNIVPPPTRGDLALCLFQPGLQRERSEFLLVAGLKRIQSVDVDQFGSEDLYTIPSGQSAQVSAIAFDYESNTLFFSTSSPTVIKLVNLTASGENSTETLAEADHVTSMAYDWTAHTLYWVDSGRRTIEVMTRTGRFRRQVLSRSSNSVESMTQLVLDPVHGWMYWLETTVSSSVVMRAWMNGDLSSVTTLTTSRFSDGYVKGLALDTVHQRLYTTTSSGQIVVRHTDGSQPSTLTMPESGRLQRPGMITLYKEYLVWVNLLDGKLWEAPIHWDNAITYMKTFNFTVTHLLAVSHLSQNAKGPCSPPTAPCSQLCAPYADVVPARGSNRTCLCGDEFTFELRGSGDQHCKCEGGSREAVQDDFCTVRNNSESCRVDQFHCRNSNRCIPGQWRCDHDDDCRDMSDETDCPYYTCPSTAFSCPSGKCISLRWHCDFDDDCGDHSDEDNCNYPSCAGNQFRCDNGRCIRSEYVCDMDNDCRDGSDERNCSTQYGASCHSWEWTCDSGECVSRSALCSGRRECQDGSDEHNCSSSSTSHPPCPSYEFQCSSGGCVFQSWRCDGDNDCGDYSDERNCTGNYSTTASPYTTPSLNRTCDFDEFRCEMGFCVSLTSICDGFDDCGDWSDEEFCDWPGNTTAVPSNCTSGQFTCSSGQCVPLSKHCDDHYDCRDNSDELDCDQRLCQDSEFECFESAYDSSRCIWGSWQCDGDDDCDHGEDERYCNATVASCPTGYFVCLVSGGCLPPSLRCNGHYDCSDHSDERSCPSQCDKYTSGKDDCCHHGCAYLSCPFDAVQGCFSNDTSIGSSCSAREHNLCLGGGSVTPLPPSRKNSFLCPYSNDVWIPSMFVCNGMTDCSFGSEEDSCTRSRMSRERVQLVDATNTSLLVSWTRGPDLATSNYTTVSYFPEHQPDLWHNVSATRVSSLRLDNLVPVTTYVVSVYTHSDDDDRDHHHPLSHTSYPSPPLRATTRPGYPSAPRNLRVDVAMDAPVLRLIWQAPANPNSHRIHYTVEVIDMNLRTSYVRDVDDEYFTVTNVESSHTYNFKVCAVTEEGYGSPPVIKTFVYNMDSPPDVSLVKVTESTVTLRWQALDRVKGYKVTALLSYQENRLISKVTTNTTFVFDQLCRGHGVSFTVEADYGNKTYGMASSPLTVILPGTTVPVISNVTVTPSEKRGVIVTYNTPPDQSHLVVYYLGDREPGEVGRFLQESQRQNTSDPHSTHISGLYACQRYFFRVGYLLDACPLSPPALVHTEEDETAPPTHLTYRFVYSEDGPVHVQLLWRPPCETIRKAVRYMVMVTSGGQLMSQPLLPATANTSISFLWTSVLRGEQYTFRVRTNATGAQLSTPITVNMPLYPAPEGFIHEVDSDFQAVYMRWQEPRDRPDDAHFLGYNVTMWREDEMVETWMTRTNQATHNITQGYWYTVSVCMAPRQGPNGKCTTHRFSAFEKATGAISRTDLVAILVPVCLVIVALAVVVVVFVVRHRRIQRSFLAFANSHYNTRSGTTTFSSDLDDDEPMIQGFSDDEPLVLA